MKPVFIYALLDPRTDVVRYCGQTIDPDRRLRRHCYPTKPEQTRKGRWVAKLLSQGLRPIMEILDVVPDSEADFWETEYIQSFRERDFDLTNLTDGGDGAALFGDKNGMFGKKHTLETLAKNRAKNTGANHPGFGKKLSPETIEKRSGSKHWSFGKPMPAATRLKIGASLTASKSPNFGKKQSPETIMKRVLATKKTKALKISQSPTME